MHVFFRVPPTERHMRQSSIDIRNRRGPKHTKSDPPQRPMKYGPCDPIWWPMLSKRTLADIWSSGDMPGTDRRIDHKLPQHPSDSDAYRPNRDRKNRTRPESEGPRSIGVPASTWNGIKLETSQHVNPRGGRTGKHALSSRKCGHTFAPTPPRRPSARPSVDGWSAERCW